MKKHLIVVLSLLLLSSCGNNEDSGSAESLNDQLNEVIGPSDSEFTGKLDELLTLEMAATISGLPKESVEIEYNQVLKNPKTHSLGYHWKSDRVKTFVVSGHNFETPASDHVTISWVSNTSLDEFKRNYHNPTEEELKNAKRAMDAKMAEMVEEGKASSEQASAGRDMAETLISNFHVTEVSGLGDYAVWIDHKQKTQDLKVFYRGLEFQINVELSDDMEDNKRKSIDLARRIILEKL